MSIPSKCDYLIIGAGIHGLSTAWHLCQKLAKKGQLKENSVVVLVFSDHGSRYLSKVYSDEWMAEQGFIQKDSNKVK